MSRKSSRDIAFKLIYQYLFNKNIDFYDIIQNFEVDTQSDDYDFIKSLYFGVIDNFDNLMQTVSNNLVDYKIDRVYKLDLAILLLACFELKNGESAGIAINEAVELAKKYSTDKGPSFINGVLAKIAK